MDNHIDHVGTETIAKRISRLKCASQNVVKEAPYFMFLLKISRFQTSFIKAKI